jgi:hypothetical protein
MNAAGIKYLPAFIREKLESRHGLQAILAIPVKTAFTWEWIAARKYGIQTPSPLFAVATCLGKIER